MEQKPGNHQSIKVEIDFLYPSIAAVLIALMHFGL